MACTYAVLHSIPSQQKNLETFKPFTGLRRGLHGIPLNPFWNIGGRSHVLSGRRATKRVQTRAGLPVVSNIPVAGPILNFVISPTLLTAIYVFGAIRFLSGFSRTIYSDTLVNRVGLTAIWPVLFLLSKAFRENFKRAVSLSS